MPDKYIAILLFALANIVNVSCSTDDSIIKEVIPFDVLAGANELPLATPDIFYTHGENQVLFVYKENFIVSIHRQKQLVENNMLLNIYQIGSEKPIYTAIEHGLYSGQFLSAIPYIHGSTLIIEDMIKEIIAVIDLNAATKDSTYIPNFRKTSILTNYMIPYYTDSILYLSPYWMENKKLKRHEIGEKFLITGPDLNHVWKDGKYLTTNITRGCFVSNKENDRIIYFDAVVDKMEIYDYKLNLIKVIYGPDNINPEYIFPHGDEKIIIQKGEAYDTYIVGACGTAYDVFVAYRGKVDKKQNTISYIFHFNWNGDLKKVYYINGIVCGPLSVSSNGSSIYTSIIDSSGNFHFNKYSIPSIKKL